MTGRSGPSVPPYYRDSTPPTVLTRGFSGVQVTIYCIGCCNQAHFSASQATTCLCLRLKISLSWLFYSTYVHTCFPRPQILYFRPSWCIAYTITIPAITLNKPMHRKPRYGIIGFHRGPSPKIEGLDWTANRDRQSAATYRFKLLILLGSGSSPLPSMYVCMYVCM